jgi:glutaredoxin 2
MEAKKHNKITWSDVNGWGMLLTSPWFYLINLPVYFFAKARKYFRDQKKK